MRIPTGLVQPSTAGLYPNGTWCAAEMSLTYLIRQDSDLRRKPFQATGPETASVTPGCSG